MIKYKVLMENTVGEIKSIMSPADIRNIRIFADKISGAFQPELSKVLYQMETELGKFGYSIGEIDIKDESIEPEGECVIFIEQFATGEMVKNAYLNLKWSKLASGQQYFYRSDKLTNSLALTVVETSPDELQKIIENDKDYQWYDVSPGNPFDKEIVK